MNAPPAIVAPGETGNGQSSRSTIFLVVSIVVAALLLYLSLSKVDWRQVWQSIVHCRLDWLSIGLVLLFGAYFARGLRWRVLLNTQAQLPILPVFWANSAGYLGNNVLPARAGELIRTAMVSSRSHLSKTFVLTTALSERLMDAIVLVIAGTVVLRFVPDRPDWLAALSNTLLVIGCIAAALVLGIPRLEGVAVRSLERSRLSPTLKTRSEAFVAHVASGVRAFHDPGTFGLFMALTGVIWGLDAYGATLMARALGMQMSIPAALLLIVGLSIGSALPSTPGYVGIYQFVAVTVLAPFHFTRSAAIAFILVAQASGLLVTGILGTIGLVQYRNMQTDGKFS